MFDSYSYSDLASGSIESYTLSDFENLLDKQSAENVQEVLEKNVGLKEHFFKCIEDHGWLEEHPKLASKVAVVLSGRSTESDKQVRYVAPLLRAGIVSNQQGLRSYAELACKTDNVDLLKILLHEGLELTQRNSEGDTVLHTAVRAGATEICDVIAKEQGSDHLFYQLTPSLHDPIALAVEVGEYSIASSLLQIFIDSSDFLFFNLSDNDQKESEQSTGIEFEGEIFYDAQSEAVADQDEIFYDAQSETEIAKQSEYDEFVNLLRTIEDSPFDGTLKFGWFSNVLPDDSEKLIDSALDAGAELHKIPDGQNVAPLAQLPRSELSYYYKKTKQEFIEVAPGTFEHLLAVAVAKADQNYGSQVIKEFQEAGLIIDAPFINKLTDGGKRPLPFGMVPCVDNCGLDVSSFAYIDTNGREIPRLLVAAACGDRKLVEELLEESNHSLTNVAAHPLYPQIVEYAVKSDNFRLGCELLEQGDSVSYPWREEVLGPLLYNAHPKWLENAMDFMSEDRVLSLARILFPMSISDVVPLVLKADDKGFSHLSEELVNATLKGGLEEETDRVKVLYGQYTDLSNTEFWEANGSTIFRACLDTKNYVLAQRCIVHDDPTKASMLQELFARGASAERDSLCLAWLSEHELSSLPKAAHALVPGAPEYSRNVCEALVNNLNNSADIARVVLQLRNSPNVIKHFVELGLNIKSIKNDRTVLCHALAANTGDLSPDFIRMLETYDGGLTKELFSRKELAHRFGIKGSTTLEGNRIRLEGGFSRDSSVVLFFYVREFHAKLRENGFKDLIQMLPSESAEVVRNLSRADVEHALEEIEEVLGFAASNPSHVELVNRVEEGQITALLTDFQVKKFSSAHAVGAVFDRDNFARCNKGYGCLETGGAGVSISKINKPGGLDEALRLLMDRSKDFSEGFGEPLSNALDLESVTHLPQSEQKVGNCSVANANSLNFAVNYFVFRKLLPDNEQAVFDIAKCLKTLRTSDSRLATLQSYLDTHSHLGEQRENLQNPNRQISTYNPDMTLIQEIYDRGGARWFPSEKQRTVRKMIDQWKRV